MDEGHQLLRPHILCDRTPLVLGGYAHMDTSTSWNLPRNVDAEGDGREGNDDSMFRSTINRKERLRQAVRTLFCSNDVVICITLDKPGHFSLRSSHDLSSTHLHVTWGSDLCVAAKQSDLSFSEVSSRSRSGATPAQAEIGRSRIFAL